MSTPLLVVVAHPDDESLGCGGTIWQAAQEGREVGLCVMSSKATARTRRPEDDELADDFARACKRLGVSKVYEGSFPNIEFNTVPHLELVQFVEAAVTDLRPHTIITHHPSDLNIDHSHTAHAVLVAARLPQRRNDASYLRSVLLMETLSATDWSFSQLGPGFVPQHFVEIGPDGLEAKLDAVRCYRDVMRDYPHSRSELAVRSLAGIRGAEAHVEYAEAFEVAVYRQLRLSSK